ncbi:MAG: DUF998 domain-containing protein [Acidilobaceae archaeon]
MLSYERVAFKNAFLALRKTMRWAWVLALVVFVVHLVLAIYVNRDWYSLTEHALSDLGSERAKSPEIFNLGLITSAVLLSFFSFYLYERFGSVPAASMLLTSALLAGVGLFPEGRSLHLFFAVSFFAMAYVTVLVSSFRLLLEKKEKTSAVVPILLTVVAVIGLLAPWPSIALLELYLIAVLTACFFVLSRA